MLYRAILAILHLVADLASGVVTFFKSQWNQFDPLGQLLFIGALVALVADMAISYNYGISMSTWHAVGFALVAFAFCVLPDVSIKMWGEGRKVAGFWFGVACVPLGIVGYQSHIGYGAGIRSGDIQQTGFQHASLEAAQRSLESEVTNIGMWRTQLGDLKEKNKANADKNAGWLVTVDPQAMQSQLDAMDQKIRNEAARVRCAAACEKLKVQRGHLAAMIASAKEENDLTERIAATQRIIDQKTAEIAGMGYRSSNVVNQNDALAKVWNLSLVALGYAADADAAIKPTAVQIQVANAASAGTASLAFMVLAPVLWAAAGAFRKAGGHHGPNGGGTRLAEPSHKPEPVATVSPPSSPAANVAPLRPATAAVAMPGLEAVHARRARATEALKMRQSRIDGGLIAVSA